ncbi:hypothetical protein DVH05_008048 [Phytophthora capsici]|nr:hypothetical protein DVH05_008048 [Phytophthora capsici]
MRLQVLRKRNEEAGHLLVDKCLLNKGNWEKKMRIKVGDENNGTLRFEIWSNAFGSSEYLQFVTGWSMNMAQWIQSGGGKRWYEVNKRGNVFAEEVANDQEWLGNENELHRSKAYVSVTVVEVGDPTMSELPQPKATKESPKTDKSTFQFVLPHRSFAKSGKLRAVRIGRIVHELRTDVLLDLLPLTLYGHENGRCMLHQRPTSNSSYEYNNSPMMKALTMLQLSCQYANYCVNTLDRYSSDLQRRRAKLQATIERVKYRQVLLKEQAENLQREKEVASCSLDGMQSLLQELDKVCH